MYKLLGADQKEYGPVSAEQIREWLAQGRANARTPLQAVGSPEWKPLSEYPEFAADFQPAQVSPAQPLLAAGSPPVATAPKTSGLAVTSLVLGCLGLLTCGITAVIGLGLGVIARIRINKSNGQLGGQGLALAGIIVSATLLVLGLIGAGIILPRVAKAKQTSASIMCMSNVRQINLGLIMYADDNKDRFPAGTAWCDSLIPYLGGSTNAFLCPAGARKLLCHYALNAGLAGRSIKDVRAPAQTVLVFEIEGGWNMSGGHELLPAKGRHSGAYVVGFADGHTEIVQPARVGQLRWEP